jgi:hypothetical protein
MNPFLRNVTDIEKREAQRAADIQRQQLDARAAQAGAFGGSRAAILEAERQRNLNQQLGDIEARGRLAAFQDAQNRLQQQFGREAGTAAQLGALGSAIPAQTFKELGALSGIGAAKQQQAQRALDIATQQAREEFGFPMRTLQDFSAILRGFPLPATKDVTQKTFSPAQPLATQLLGVGTGLAGLAGAAGAFKKAGGRVGGPSPVRLKHGGYIKLAAGGGLSQLMRGKLPSNRVRMGKTAYQDVTNFNINELINPKGPNPLSVLTEEELVVSLRDPQKLSDLSAAGITILDIRKELADRQLTSTRLQQDTTKKDSRTPAAIALDATQRAAAARNIGTGDTPTLEAERFMSFNPKTGALTPRVEPILQSQLRSLSPEQQLKPEETIEEMFTAGESPMVQAPNLMSASADVPRVPFSRLPQNYRVSESDLVSATVEGLPEDAGGGQRYGEAASLFKQGQPLHAGPSMTERFLRTPFGSDVSRLLEGESQEEFIKRIAQPNRAMLSIGDLGDKAWSYFTGTKKEYEALKKEQQLKLDKRRQEILDREGVDIEEAFTAGESPGVSVTEASAIETTASPASAKKAGPAPANTAKKAPAASAEKKDIDLLTGGKERIDILQADFDQQVSDIQNRDYSADIKKMIGDAPTYEKGEEPDFAARKWLALANFGAGLLASGGGKTLAQSIGEAAKPALKELADIGKEERKIKKELRQERNAQKRADYQDELKRFDLRRQLKSDDLDLLQKVANIKLQRQKNQITDKQAETQAAAAMSTIRLNNEKLFAQQIKNFTSDGQISLGNLMATIDAQEASIKASTRSMGQTLGGLAGPPLDANLKITQQSILSRLENYKNLLESDPLAVFSATRKDGKVERKSALNQVNQLIAKYRKKVGSSGQPKNPRVTRKVGLPAAPTGPVLNTVQVKNEDEDEEGK